MYFVLWAQAECEYQAVCSSWAADRHPASLKPRNDTDKPDSGGFNPTPIFASLLFCPATSHPAAVKDLNFVRNHEQIKRNYIKLEKNIKTDFTDICERRKQEREVETQAAELRALQTLQTLQSHHTVSEGSESQPSEGCQDAEAKERYVIHRVRLLLGDQDDAPGGRAVITAGAGGERARPGQGGQTSDHAVCTEIKSGWLVGTQSLLTHIPYTLMICLCVLCTDI